MRLTPAPVIRFLAELVRAQHRDQLLLRSASLAYTSLLSVVPILTVLLVTTASVDPARAEIVVRGIAAVLPFSPQQVQDTLASFAERTAAGGFIAIVLSFLITANVFYQVEEVVNSVWAVPRRRSWRVRLASFAALLFTGPMMLFALFFGLFWLSSRPFYSAVGTLGRPLPALIALAVLTGLYRWVPNTRVPWRAAALGAAVATTAMLLLHNGFQVYLSVIDELSLIYGSLTMVLLFLVSLVLFWFAILLGAEASWVVAQSTQPARPAGEAVLALLAEAQRHGEVARKRADELLGARADEILSRLSAAPPILAGGRRGISLACEPDDVTIGQVMCRLAGLHVANGAPDHAASLASLVDARDGEAAGGPSPEATLGPQA